MALADKITKPLQSTVSYERYISSDGSGSQSFASPVQLHAIVDWKQRQLRTADGSLTVSRASILLLSITEVFAATNGAGVGDDDRWTLADGTTGPVIDMGGFIDAGTSHPLATEVYLG